MVCSGEVNCRLHSIEEKLAMNVISKQVSAVFNHSKVNSSINTLRNDIINCVLLSL